MKAIKIIILLLLLCGESKTIHAQYFYNCKIKPAHPTINDSIFLIDSISLVYQSMRLYYDSVYFNANYFIVNQCYNHAGGITIGRQTSEITALGKLSSGMYSGIIYSHSQYDPVDTDCSQYGIRDSIRFSFTVSTPSGLSEINDTDFNFSPNPARDKLNSGYSLHDLALTITDLTGRICPSPHTDRDIDISSLPAGLYTLRLQSRDATIVRRFVKE